MSYDTFDNYIFTAAMYGSRTVSLDEAQRVLEPLEWYVKTGRASCDFMRKLSAKKPYCIFRVMHKTGGSYEDAIQAVKQYLGIA